MPPFLTCPTIHNLLRKVNGDKLRDSTPRYSECSEDDAKVVRQVTQGNLQIFDEVNGGECMYE